ncbi:uncharacterized protein TNCV_5088181 [Trichonephila clavipes]|nr:uncharacterized protein TNCV_5088181 [Trichonephila clavipes]
MEEKIERDRMSQVRMDCQPRVPRYWPKSGRGGGKCVATDMVYNNSYYDLPNICPTAPKKWHVKILDNGVHAHWCCDGVRHMRDGFASHP